MHTHQNQSVFMTKKYEHYKSLGWIFIKICKEDRLFLTSVLIYPAYSAFNL